MAVSGTVPFWDYSDTAGPSPAAVVTVTGAAAGPGLASGGTLVSGTGVGGSDSIFASEPLNAAFRRLVVALSGVSGAENVQRELAMRAADHESGELSNAKRLAIANTILTDQEAQ